MSKSAPLVPSSPPSPHFSIWLSASLIIPQKTFYAKDLWNPRNPTAYRGKKQQPSHHWNVSESEEPYQE